ncbi:hypothetical protein TIFTF001_023345 [Ficus carica]|uniref:Transmembrane protein n=1 Tax=Ficus carica TaxID=3494 RepID=A0AA88B002_FICCA|nr:hypothetical protein TIFTF001_023345 [Ficus carica]
MATDDIPQDPNDPESSKPWTMVVIRDSLPKTEFTVFPPTNHENLHPSLHNTVPVSPSLSSSSSLASSSSSSSFSPSDSDQSDPDSPVASDSPIRRTDEARWWVRIGLEVMRCRILRLVSSFGGNGVVWWKASFFGSSAGIAAAAAAAVAVIIWSLYVRARQRRKMENLMVVVREKDQVSFSLLIDCVLGVC